MDPGIQKGGLHIAMYTVTFDERFGSSSIARKRFKFTISCGRQHLQAILPLKSKVRPGAEYWGVISNYTKRLFASWSMTFPLTHKIVQKEPYIYCSTH